MAIADNILDLIVSGAKSITRGAGATSKARRAKPVKPRTTDEQIDEILAQGGLTRADLARDYPEVAPPVPSIDPKTGKPYLAKGASREAEAVARARKLLQDDIKRGDYDQYFDVSARYNANPANYVRPDLTKDMVPARAATTQKYQDLYAGPESAARLDAAIANAIDDPGAHGFYKLGQLEDEFIRMLGPEQGPRAFEERVMDAMAATTGGADPTSNLLMASLGNFIKQRRLNPTPGTNMPPPDFPRRAYEMPYPVGGRFASGNMAMFEKMIGVDAPGTGVTAANPKRYDFSTSFGGFTDRPVIDEQMMKAVDPTSDGSPSSNAYGIARQAVADAAGRAGLAPIGGQEVGWAGIKNVPGKPMIQNYNEAIYRTSRLTGLSPEKVLEGMARGTIPVYGMGGVATAGLLSMSPEEQAQAEIENYLRGR
jgi:hypothetical protein